MIRIVLGLPGSGKTASTVRDLVRNPSTRKTYTNIDVKRLKNAVKITPDMLIKKEVKKVKRDGTSEYDYKFNREFWQSVIEKEGSINVVIDEAHIYFNPRRSMSKLNIIMSDFLAMLRRILGSSDGGGGELILITQLPRRIDVIAREMATKVQHCICYYDKHCLTCGFTWAETNETSDQSWKCLRCNSERVKKEHIEIHVREFRNMNAFDLWIEYGARQYYARYTITDIESYFDYYNTLQWDDLFTEFFE